jgi:hypothetical protein
MNCHLEFSYLVIIEKLGKSFMDKVLKPAVVNELLMEEKRGLSNLASLVEWKRKVEEIEKRVRFGEVYHLPEKPVVNNRDGVFPCPREDCRGFYAVSYLSSEIASEVEVNSRDCGGYEVYCEQCKYAICSQCEVVLGKQ